VTTGALLIGFDKTLGVSAADTDALLKLQSTGVVDYYAYGPFASAVTDEPNVHSPLGFNGYRQLEKLGIGMPVIAVGGIRLDDVEHLLQTGIDGIAVSSAINLVADPAAKVKEFYRKMY
jgi:thiamine-phosphate pyrophosphorylase